MCTEFVHHRDEVRIYGRKTARRPVVTATCKGGYDEEHYDRRKEESAHDSDLQGLEGGRRNLAGGWGCSFLHTMYLRDRRFSIGFVVVALGPETTRGWTSGLPGRIDFLS